MFSSVLAEVFAGSYGLLIPFASFAIFYISVVYGWELGVFIAIFAGFAVDFLFSRDFLLISMIYPIIPFLGILWKKRGFVKTYITQFVPGVFISVFISFSISVRFLLNKGSNINEFLYLLSQMVLAVIAGILLFPLLIFTLDQISAFLEISRYKESSTTTETSKFQK